MSMDAAVVAGTQIPVVDFAGFASDDLRVFGDVLAYDKKCGFYVPLSQQIEEPRRELFARAVIEGHGDVRTVDVHRIKCHARLFWSRVDRGCLRRAPLGLSKNRGENQR